MTRQKQRPERAPWEPEPPPPIVSRYRCPDHPDVPVTWRGRGCVACAAQVRSEFDEEVSW